MAADLPTGIGLAEGRSLVEFPWVAMIWFIAATIIYFILEVKADVIKENDPELYLKRRRTVMAYCFVLMGVNLIQMITWIQLVDFFNFIITMGLFVAFWFIESGSKKKLARTMALITLLAAVLSLFGAPA